MWWENCSIRSRSAAGHGPTFRYRWHTDITIRRYLQALRPPFKANYGLECSRASCISWLWSCRCSWSLPQEESAHFLCLHGLAERRRESRGIMHLDQNKENWEKKGASPCKLGFNPGIQRPWMYICQPNSNASWWMECSDVLRHLCDITAVLDGSS